MLAGCARTSRFAGYSLNSPAGWCGEGFAAVSARLRLRRVLAAGACALAASVAPAGAHAQGRLEARYVATLAGLPIGRGNWVIDITDNQYTAAASAKTTGL